jgi:hypothetical protein
MWDGYSLLVMFVLAFLWAFLLSSKGLQSYLLLFSIRRFCFLILHLGFFNDGRGRWPSS